MASPRVELIKKYREQYEPRFEDIRNDDTRTPQWKATEMARVYRDLTQRLEREIEDLEEGAGRRIRQLEARVFGTESLPGDPASLSISRRDASDRVDQLETNEQALTLLRKASRSGDEVLARSIAQWAYEQQSMEVANAFLTDRPELDAPFSELWGNARPAKIRDDIAFQMIKDSLRPPELPADPFALQRLLGEDAAVDFGIAGGSGLG